MPEGGWQSGRVGRNHYIKAHFIAAGLTEGDKDPLGAGRTSTLLNNDRGPSSLCRQNKQIHA